MRPMFCVFLSMVFIFSGCGLSAPETSSVEQTNKLPLIGITMSPTLDGMSIRETQRIQTVFAIQTALVTPIPTRPATQTFTPEPTLTPTPLSPNSILISYTIIAGDGVDEITACMYGYNTPRFVLYRNGQLVVFDKTRYLETIISQDEIDVLLKRIEDTGFFSVEGTGDQYLPNAPTPVYIGGWGSYITVENKTLEILSAQSDYMIETIKKTLDIIEAYRPMDMKPYIPDPDKASIWSILVHDTSFGDYKPTPVPPEMKWSADLIRLDELVGKPHFISGNAYMFLMREVKSIPALRMVEQNGQHYLVMVCSTFE